MLWQESYRPNQYAKTKLFGQYNRQNNLEFALLKHFIQDASVSVIIIFLQLWCAEERWLKYISRLSLEEIQAGVSPEDIRGACDCSIRLL